MKPPKRTARSKAKRLSGATAGVGVENSNASVQCPFPGIVVESILSFFKDDEELEDDPYSSDQLRLFGAGYCVIFAAAVGATVVTLFRADARISQLAIAALTLAVLAVVLSFLHFGTHFAMTLFPTLMKQPAYRIASIRHLQIAVSPLLLLFLAQLGFGLFYLYTAMSQNDYGSSFWEGLALLLCGVGGPFIALKAVLNPNHLGVNVDKRATPAETFLGIGAVVTRAPMYCARSIFPLAMILANVGAMLFLLNALGIDSIKLGMASSGMFGGGLVGICFPLFAYGLAFQGLFSIELIQAVFDIRRNTQAAR